MQDSDSIDRYLYLGPLKLFLGNNIWKCKVHFSFWIKLISFYIRVILQFSQKLKRISVLAVWIWIILWISLIHDKYVEKYFLSAIEIDIWWIFARYVCFSSPPDPE